MAPSGLSRSVRPQERQSETSMPEAGNYPAKGGENFAVRGEIGAGGDGEGLPISGYRSAVDEGLATGRSLRFPWIEKGRLGRYGRTCFDESEPSREHSAAPVTQSASDILAQAVGTAVVLSMAVLFSYRKHVWAFLKRFAGLKTKTKQLAVLLVIAIWYTISIVYFGSQYTNVRLSFAASEAFFSPCNSFRWNRCLVAWADQKRLASFGSLVFKLRHYPAGGLNSGNRYKPRTDM